MSSLLSVLEIPCVAFVVRLRPLSLAVMMTDSAPLSAALAGWSLSPKSHCTVIVALMVFVNDSF